MSATTQGPQLVVMVGRPNAGKSSLFNALSGASARVANFPGITVDLLVAEVTAPAGERLRLVDAPGVYSLEGDTDPDSDEGLTRRYLDELAAERRPHVIAQVIDVNQLALGLSLTRELASRGAPLVLLVTQTDILAEQGWELDAAALIATLGVPVVLTSARDQAGPPRVLAALASAASATLPPAWPAALDLSSLAGRVLREAERVRPTALSARRRTERLDAVLLGPVLGPLLFLAIMTVVFVAVFVVAEPVTAILDAGTRALGARLEAALGAGRLTSLLVDGVLGGAGTVLAFLPQIVILTIAMELIDGSGYLARGAFLTDRLLGLAGLGGRSFVPLLTAHACAVPAIHAARIVRDPRQRLRTILVLPLMTCSARLPTYGLLITAFLGGRGAFARGAAYVGLYLAGVASGLLASRVLGSVVPRAGRSLLLVLELPAYRRPEARVVVAVALRASRRFLREVGSTLLVAAVVLWALLNLPGPGREQAVAAAPPGASARVIELHGSLAAAVGRRLEPVTRLAGFDWRVNVGLLASFGARELMVGTLGIIFGLERDDDAVVVPLAARLRDARAPDGARLYGLPTALALMAFFVIACQCVSTVVAIARETRSLRWPAFVIGYTYACAYGLAVLVYQTARWAGL